MSVCITASALAAILEAARDAYPHEACGLLLGHQGTIARAQATANIAPDPARHFEIDPTALIAAHRAARGGGPALIGYFHSHPTGIAAPSATDQAMAARDDRIWAIAAGDAITLWRDGQSGFEPLSYDVVAG
jgi:desampylase